MSRALSALEEHRGLGLLLALSSTGCLGLPRFDEPIDDDSGTETGDETAHTTGGPGPMPTTAPPPTTGPLPTTSTTGMPTSTTSTGPMSTVTTAPPPPILDVNQGLAGCQAYAEIMDYCYGEPRGEQAYDFCTQYVEYLQEDFPECVPVLDAFFVCLSTLPCDELFGPETPCEPLIDVFFECTSG